MIIIMKIKQNKNLISSEMIFTMGQKNYSVEFNQGYTIIKLDHLLDYFNCKLFIEEMPSIARKQNHVLINCEKVTAIPKDWIRALMLFQMSLKKINKGLKLVHVNQNVLVCLKKEGIDQFFKVSLDVKDALEEFGISVKKKMDMEFLNPFLSATIKVLKIQAHTHAQPGKIYLKKPTDKLYGDISGIIGIVSDNFKGSVVISFPKNTFLKLMSRMLGEEVLTIDREIFDGAGEITNMIFGQAKVELNAKGFGIKTALPSVVSGENHSHSSTTRGPVMVVPFESDIGSFFVEIGLSD